MVENEYQHPYFENRSTSEGFSIFPLVNVQFQYDEQETISESDTRSRLSKTFRIHVEWPVKTDITEFITTYKNWVNSHHTARDTDDDEIQTQATENTLHETWAQAFVEGDTGYNLHDYDSLANQPFESLKEESTTIEEPIDWGQLYHAELTGKNRESVKNWIHQQRINSYPIRFENVTFAYLQDQPFYPDQIGHLALGAFMDPPAVSWWDGIGTNLGFVPDFEERQPEDSDERREFQNKLDEKYSNITLIHEFKQQFDYEDGSYEPEISGTLDTPTFELERLEFFFKETVIPSFAERAAEEHNLEDGDAAIEYALEQIRDKAHKAINDFGATEECLNTLETSNSRRE